ncbi:MAG: hydrogenase maturation protease [Actinomycetota bacterium]
MSAVVIGLGNDFRRDDGIGPAVAAAVRDLGLPDVVVHIGARDTGELLDAWADAEVAVIVDAAAGPGARPGRLRRWTPDHTDRAMTLSSHAVEPFSAYALGVALGRVPRRVVVLSVDVVDVGHGVGLSPALAAALPAAVAAVVAEIEWRGPTPRDQGPKTPQPSV